MAVGQARALSATRAKAGAPADCRRPPSHCPSPPPHPTHTHPYTPTCPRRGGPSAHTAGGRARWCARRPGRRWPGGWGRPAAARSRRRGEPPAGGGGCVGMGVGGWVRDWWVRDWWAGVGSPPPPPITSTTHHTPPIAHARLGREHQPPSAPTPTQQPPSPTPTHSTRARAWGVNISRPALSPNGLMVMRSSGGSPGVSANATARAASARDDVRVRGAGCGA